MTLCICHLHVVCLTQWMCQEDKNLETKLASVLFLLESIGFSECLQKYLTCQSKRPKKTN